MLNECVKLSRRCRHANANQRPKGIFNRGKGQRWENRGGGWGYRNPPDFGAGVQYFEKNIFINPCTAAPGCTRIAETHPTAAPGSKKKKKKFFFFFFFKMFNGKDSDMLVVIVGQYCSA